MPSEACSINSGPGALSDALLSALARVRDCAAQVETEHGRERRAHEARLETLVKQQADLDHRRAAQTAERAGAMADEAEEAEMLKRAEAELEAMQLRAAANREDRPESVAAQEEAPGTQPDSGDACIEQIAASMEEAALALAAVTAAAPAWQEAATEGEALAAAGVRASLAEIERNNAEIVAIRDRAAGVRERRLAVEAQIRNLAALRLAAETISGSNDWQGSEYKRSH